MADETTEMENQWLMSWRFLVKLSPFEIYSGWFTNMPRVTHTHTHTHTHTGTMYQRVTVLQWHYIPFKHILTWLLYDNRKFILAWLSESGHVYKRTLFSWCNPHQAAQLWCLRWWQILLLDHWTQSYHAVHCKVVVLGLQLQHMLMFGSYLCVGCQEQAFIMDNPIKHLLKGKNGNYGLWNIYLYALSLRNTISLFIKTWLWWNSDSIKSCLSMDLFVNNHIKWFGFIFCCFLYIFDY